MLGERRGVALPIAVFALLIVTVLITGVLLTSSTEVAVSGAHQDATAQLYTAEGAIEDYATRNLSSVVAYNTSFTLPTTQPFTHTPVGGNPVTMTVTQLSETPNPGFPEPDRTYALTATPVGGGRTVTAITRLTSKILQVADLIPIWSGTALALKGNTSVKKSSPTLCPTGPAAPDAIQYSGTTAPTQGNNVTVEDNDIQPTTIRPLDYVSATFGTTIEGLLAASNDGAGPNIYWGPQAWGNSRQVDSDQDRSTNLNWGCPQAMLAGTNSACPVNGDGDETYYPLVGIDATGSSTNPWGTVIVNGKHGQGLLVVANGDLNVQGNFQFCGIIVVEGSIKLNATGGGLQPKIEGAVIALGMGGNNSEDAYVGDNTIAGSPQISYNKCCIDKVNEAFVLNNTQVRSVVPTFAWNEVVR